VLRPSLPHSPTPVCANAAERLWFGAEVERCTNELTSFAGVKDRVEIITTIKDDVRARADIVTNSGHLRPIGRSIISKFPQHCVIALIFETWEFRTSDIDVAAARERSIPIIGVNEHHPAVDVFPYLGRFCGNMLHEAGIPVYGSRIALVNAGGKVHPEQKCISEADKKGR
jgi:hypothetical protein